jgi:transposase
MNYSREEFSMPIPFKSDPTKFNQRLLFPTNVFDLLPKEHECFVYDAMFQQIDIASIEGQYSYIGQRAYDPRLVVGILIYGYTRGVFSSRQIEKRCHEDLSFMYVSHMNCPNFRVLSDFRKDNPEFLKKCFIQSALLAKELGMVSFGHVSLDGSKFKANTSKHKAMSYDYLNLKEEELVNEINKLMAQAEQCDQEEDERFQDKASFDIP